MVSYTLAFVLASLYGLVFYLVFGQGWTRMILYWAVAAAGFGLGQWIASAVGLGIFNIGELNLVEGTLVSWLSLLAARMWRR